MVSSQFDQSFYAGTGKAHFSGRERILKDY